jgi:hypothetical protein
MLPLKPYGFQPWLTPFLVPLFLLDLKVPGLQGVTDE